MSCVVTVMCSMAFEINIAFYHMAAVGMPNGTMKHIRMSQMAMAALAVIFSTEIPQRPMSHV